MSDLKIYRYVPRGYQEREYDEPDFALDFQTGLTRRLHPKATQVMGEVQLIEYFATCVQTSLGVETFSDPIVQEAITYTRDADHFALTQSKVISWYREDETLHPTTKTLDKVYSATESIREGIRRRSNIIDKLKVDVLGLLMATSAGTVDDGRTFLAAQEDRILLFVDAASNSLYDEVNTTTAYAWMDTPIGGGATIRNYMLASINIWGL